MEPTKNKKKIIYIIILVIISAAIVVAILINPKVKVEAPINNDPLITTPSNTEQPDQISKEIDDATTFDNENDLQVIDKEFQNN